MNIDIYTLGVYGLSEEDFFNKIVENNIDTFCDIRRRRAVRGSKYSFVNSKKLQLKLKNLTINYIHEIGLAPTNEIRNIQNILDKNKKINKRNREELSVPFKEAYKEQVLSNFNIHDFLNNFKKKDRKKILLFCVEKSPNACHRSLITQKIQELYPNTLIIDL